MNKKTIGILIANICLCYGLIAELNWWRPKEIPLIKGWLDTRSMAMNGNGKAIVFFGDKIFGSYDINTNQWKFIKLDIGSEEVRFESIELQENEALYCSESFNDQKVVLNNDDRGFVVFRLTEGPDVGKIGCLSYLNDHWESLTLLSEGVGSTPIIAQASYGGAVAVWINKEKENKDCLMGAYYDGSDWINKGCLFENKNIKMNDNEANLQLAMNEMDDVIVVGKAYDQEKNQEDNRYIVANYFDGVKLKWGEGEILAQQSRNNKGIHLSMNSRGDTFVVWKSDQGIEGSFFNLSQYMLKNFCGVKELNLAEWTKDSIAQGENLYAPKVAVDDKGNGVAIWFQDHAGMASSYCNVINKSWSGVSLVDSKVIYSSNIKANENGIYAIWIGEAKPLQEHIFGAFFDVASKTWRNRQDLHLKDGNSSFVEDVEAFSLAEKNYGMLVWYDLFKEQLFYSLLKEEIDLFYMQSKKEGRRAFLSEEKAKTAKYKAQRKNQMLKSENRWNKFKKTR